MNQASIKAAKRLVPQNYVEQAIQASKKHQNQITQLLEQRKCPKEGWDEATIRIFLQQISSMDSNNFVNSCGVGEREARFASDIVAQRHFWLNQYCTWCDSLGHGIGRSGDVTEAQPKAAGSSLVNVLANALMLDILKNTGVPNTQSCFILPMATGMSLTLCLLTIRHQNPSAKYVIWSRIDQKSCLKCSMTAGFEVVVVDPIIVKDELHTNMNKINHLVENMDHRSIACILSTTSCFSPRAPDDVVAISKLCKSNNIPHIINNAYGLQCPSIMNLICKASRKGRIDAFVQSTDKNLMVPVGGAIIAGFDHEFIAAIGKLYPGRASASPSMDVLITLLTLGMDGYQNLIINRNTMFMYLKEQFRFTAERYQEKILETPNNPISLAMTLSFTDSKELTEIGSMLFTKLVSGTRVVVPGEVKTVEKIKFTGWGSHCPHYHTPYLTAAASIGITKLDVDSFVSKLDKVLVKFKEAFFKAAISKNQLEMGQDTQDKIPRRKSNESLKTPKPSPNHARSPKAEKKNNLDSTGDTSNSIESSSEFKEGITSEFSSTKDFANLDLSGEINHKC